MFELPLIPIKDAITEMRDLLVNTLKTTIPQAITIAATWAANSEARLTKLAVGALSGKLSWAWVALRLKDEPINIKQEFEGIEQIEAANLAEAANSAVAIFENFLKNMLSTIPEADIKELAN